MAQAHQLDIGQALGIDPEHVEKVIGEALAGYVAEGRPAGIEAG